MKPQNMPQERQTEAMQALESPLARQGARIELTGFTFICAAVLQSRSAWKRKLLRLRVIL
jgi:hypothetical protein